LSALTGRMTTYLATAAVVVSLFVSVLPEQRDFPATVAVILGFIPFLAIAYISLRGPQEVEKNWAGGKGPIEQVNEWERKPFKGLVDEPLHIASYEQWERIDIARDRAFGHTFPEALLPENDWLVAEVTRLKLRLGQARQRIERTRERLRMLATLLTSLVLYLVVTNAAIELL
jgi:hypothetical protein